MNSLALDKYIYYLLILYALASTISIAVSNIAVSLATLLALIRYVKEPISLRMNKKILQVVGVFLVAGLVSSLLSFAPLVGINTLWGYVYRMFPMFLALAFLRRKEQLYSVMVTMAISILISSLYGIWQGIHGIRAEAFTSNPMILAGVLIQMIPFLIIMGLEYSEIQQNIRIVLLSVSGVSTIALLFNQTRGAWLAVAFFLLIYVCKSVRQSRKGVVVLTLLLVICSVMVASNQFMKERLQSITDMTTNQSNIERILLWESSRNIILDHPVFGIGLGNFKKVYNEQYISPQAKVPELGHAHNNFLQIFAETGCVGGIPFIIMFAYFLFFSLKKYRQGFIISGILFFSTVTLMIQGFTEFNFGDSAVIRMYWFIFGIALAEIALDEKYDREKLGYFS